MNPYIQRILQREGGYVNNPNDRGGMTNYGISQRAYPNLDIANLTPEDAAGIYQRDYYDAIGADMLPESIREIAFDAAVNHGPSYAKQLIQQAGGDPETMLNLRRQKYNDIIANDPSQEIFRNGWENRLAGLTPDESLPYVDTPNIEQGIMAPMVVDEQTDAERQMDQYLQEELAEPTPMQAFMESVGQGAPSGPYAGNSGFAGGFMQGAAGASRARNAQAARRVAAIKGRLEMERLRQKQRIKNDWKVADGTAYRTDPETGELQTKQIGQIEEGGIPGYKDPAQYVTASGGIRDDFDKRATPLNIIRKRFTDAENTVKRYKGFDKWKGSDDIALVFNLMKVLDPNSTVREGEQAQASAVAGPAKSWLGMYNNLIKGEGKLVDTAREQIYNTMKDAYMSRREEAKGLVDQYGEMADYAGVRRQDVYGREPLKKWADPVDMTSLGVFGKEEDEFFGTVEDDR